MIGWDQFKQGFDAWERITADYLERLLQSDSVLRPAGSLLTFSMKTKAATDKAAAAWWGAMGLSTRRDQERALHALNQLESKILDLEERLEDLGEA